VDFANKRRGGCRGKRSSYYLVERTVVFSECTLPVCEPQPKFRSSQQRTKSNQSTEHSNTEKLSLSDLDLSRATKVRTCSAIAPTLETMTSLGRLIRLFILTWGIQEARAHLRDLAKNEKVGRILSIEDFGGTLSD
jgi:hypothetical protein